VGGIGGAGLGGAGGPDAGGPGGLAGGPGGIGPGVGPGVPGFPGGRPGGEPPASEVKGNWFVTVVEVDHSISDRDRNGPSQGHFLRHRWGSAALNPSTTIEGRAKLQLYRVEKTDKMLANKRDQFKDDPFRLMEWMLQHWNFPDQGKFDMQKEFEKLIDDLSRRTNLDATAQAKVKALVDTRESLKKILNEPTEELARIGALPGLGEYRPTKSSHYVLLHSSRDDKKEISGRRLERLERAYAGFFYWFALQGKPLTPPDKMLVCVLAENSEKFRELHKLFDSLPLVSDGFYTSLDNVAVLAKTRVDSPFEQFQNIASDYEKSVSQAGIDLERLLTGNLPRFRPNDQSAPTPETLTLGRILALANRAAIEEGELASVTHEGVQQLAAATGVLARRVQVPMSVRFGLGAFFETPKSYGETDAPALWSGVGGPHWVYLPLFKKLVEADKSGTLSFDRGGYADRKIKVDKLSLLKVLTDHNFEAAAKAKAEEQDILRDKARAESWALMHFLMRQKQTQLRAFFDELASMPRDMDLSPEIVEAVFARSFGLQRADDPDRTDPDKLASLEKAWKDFLGYQAFEVNLSETPAKKPQQPPMR
jgi:hypothetical protein